MSKKRVDKAVTTTQRELFGVELSHLLCTYCQVDSWDTATTRLSVISPGQQYIFLGRIQYHSS